MLSVTNSNGGIPGTIVAPVTAGTTTNFAATYNNGVNGVGATLVATSFGSLSIDGVSPSVGQRVLIKNQITQFQNGIYVVTSTGGMLSRATLQRAPDFDEPSEITNGVLVDVENGTVNSQTLWQQTSVVNNIGVDAITFVSVGAGVFNPSIAIVTDANGKLTSSTTTATEIGYVHNVTSPIQTQLNSKLPSIGASTNNAIALWDSTLGAAIKNSLATVDGSGNIATPGSITIAGNLNLTLPLPYLGLNGLFYIAAGTFVQAFPPGNASTTFNWTNQGTATVTAFGTAPNTAFFMNAPRTSTDSLRLYGLTYGGTTTITAAILPLIISDNVPQIGLGYGSISNTNFIGIQVVSDGNGLMEIQVSKWTSPTAFSALPFDKILAGNTGIWWFQIQQDNTNVYFRYSTDGYNFVQVYSEAIATFISNPDKPAFSINAVQSANTQPVGATLLSWQKTT